jgi:hypothetical protein
MNVDGDIDPSRYTREQLVGVIGRMDRDRYPLNYEILLKELASRPEVIEATVSTDPRPPSIRAASSLILAAAALQGFMVLVIVLAMRAPRVATIMNVALLATFAYQYLALRRGHIDVRKSLVFLLVFVVIAVIGNWTRIAWYSGQGWVFDIIVDAGRLGSVVLAVINLYQPESAKWFAERGQRDIHDSSESSAAQQTHGALRDT